MANLNISNTYALVLNDLGVDKGDLDELAADLAAFNEIVSNEPDFSVFLSVPGIDKETKKRFLSKVLTGKTSTRFLDFLDVLVDNGRIEESFQIEKSLLDIIDDEKKRIRVTVTTQSPLRDSERENLIKVLTKKFGKQAILEEVTDSSILGGVIIKAGDTVIDGSLASRIRFIQSKLQSTQIKGESVYEN